MSVSAPVAGRRHRILIVEDNVDTREALAMALHLEGYDVEEAATASEGLARLETGGYALVLADYDLPDQSGAWMLGAAREKGWLGGTRAMVVTAHSQLDGLGLDVVYKPVDLATFLPLVSKIVGRLSGDPPAPRGAGAVRERPRLALYVSRDSVASQAALSSLRALLEREPRAVDLDVYDVADEPAAAERGNVVFTPTLVMVAPEPALWLVGDLRNADAVRDVLDAYGVSLAGSRA